MASDGVDPRELEGNDAVDPRELKFAARWTKSSTALVDAFCFDVQPALMQN